MNQQLFVQPRSIARPHHRGFTLVELLVAIGIIAVLISILMPALTRARKAAQTVVCASNMRQIGAAMFLYHTEHKVLPYGGIGFSSTQQISWDDLISRQLGKNLPWSDTSGGTNKEVGILWVRLPYSNEILICPSDNNGQLWTDPLQYRRSYAVPWADIDGNGESDTLFAYTSSWPPAAGKIFRSYKLTDARQSAATLLLVERHGNFNIQGTINNVYAQYTNDQFCKTNELTPVSINGAHSRKWNYLFADGHAELLSDKDTWGNAAKNPNYIGRWWSLGPWTRHVGD